MSEWAIFDSDNQWGSFNPCPHCAYPLPRTQPLCPSCHHPRSWLSWQGLIVLKQRAFRATRISLSLLLFAGAFLIVVIVATQLAPLLVIFPLLAVASPPPASRGGRTVARGKKRHQGP